MQIILGLVFLIMLYATNPTQEEFDKYIVNNFNFVTPTLRDASSDPLVRSMLMSMLSRVKRKDYVLLSVFTLDYPLLSLAQPNKDFSQKIIGVGTIFISLDMGERLGEIVNNVKNPNLATKPLIQQNVSLPLVRSSGFVIQITTEENLVNAMSQITGLEKIGLRNGYYESKVINGKNYYLVKLGPYLKQEDAQQALALIRQFGHKSAAIKEE